MKLVESWIISHWAKPSRSNLILNETQYILHCDMLLDGKEVMRVSTFFRTTDSIICEGSFLFEANTKHLYDARRG